MAEAFLNNKPGSPPMGPYHAISTIHGNMSAQLEELKQTWSKLGTDDPFWAVVSHGNKRNGKWDIESFLETGRANVKYYHQLMVLHAAAPEHFDSVLDFGCGVGRLSLAWSERADRVVGVDISQPMIENARKLADKQTNIEFLVNQTEDLSCFADTPAKKILKPNYKT
jgi:2-polyprenyl-3-methyl-5-hydroxy-6-metoxy-1,4-benzoquinol methylase